MPSAKNASPSIAKAWTQCPEEPSSFRKDFLGLKIDQRDTPTCDPTRPHLRRADVHRLVSISATQCLHRHPSVIVRGRESPPVWRSFSISQSLLQEPIPIGPLLRSLWPNAQRRVFRVQLNTRPGIRHSHLIAQHRIGYRASVRPLEHTFHVVHSSVDLVAPEFFAQLLYVGHVFLKLQFVQFPVDKNICVERDGANEHQRNDSCDDNSRKFFSLQETEHDLLFSSPDC